MSYSELLSVSVKFSRHFKGLLFFFNLKSFVSIIHTLKKVAH